MKLKCIFALLKTMKPTEYGMNTIHDLSTGHTKEFLYICDYGWKLLEPHFMLFYANFK